MDVELSQVPPTGNLINLELSQLCALMHYKSEEDQPGPSKQADTNELQKLKNDLETILKDMVLHEHYKQFMAQAIKANHPHQALHPKSILLLKAKPLTLQKRSTSF